MLEGVHHEALVKAGQILGLNCRVGLTQPPVRVTWFINGQPSDVYNVPAPVEQIYDKRPQPEIKSVRIKEVIYLSNIMLISNNSNSVL